MNILNICIIILLTSLARSTSQKVQDFQYTEIERGYELGLEENYHQDPTSQLPSLKNSASKFLLEVYKDFTENEGELDHVREYLEHGSRQKRALRVENFITNFDRKIIKECNNVITFSSKKTLKSNKQLVPDISIISDMEIGFNINDVPRDLHLLHSGLRLYQKPSLGKYAQDTVIQNATISIYQKTMYDKEYSGALKCLTSVSTTTGFQGWLELNMTAILNRWLRQNFYQPENIKLLIVSVTLKADNPVEILASDLGLVKPDNSEEMLGLQPFIIGYFNGSGLLINLKKKSVTKREASNGDQKIYMQRPQPTPIQTTYDLTKACQRLNFTVDFRDIGMNKVVIAPKNLEVFFCGGQCNFPLGRKMNSTNHAIVQTLMHLTKPEVAKPSCVPTVLGSVSILHYINSDSVNLSKYPHSVAKECGCL